MLKKLCRWLSMLSPVCFLLPLLVNTWCVERKETKLLEAEVVDSWKLLNTPEEYLADGVIFNNTWIKIFGILVIVALVFAVILLVVYLLNSLKVTKLGKLEKPLAIILTVASLLVLVCGLVAIFTNAHIGLDLVVTTTDTARLLPALGFYFAGICGFVLSLFAVFGSKSK